MLPSINNLSLVFCVAMWCAWIPAQAQNDTAKTLLLLNGNEIVVSDFTDDSAADLKYVYDKNQFKRRKIRLREGRKSGLYFDAPMTEKARKVPVVAVQGSTPREEAFAVIHPSGETRYFFEPDSLLGYSLEEMESFVYGQRDAMYTVRGKGWFWGGMGVGLAAGYLLETSVFSLAVPPLVAIGARIPVVHVKSEYISDARFFNDADYASGFATRARAKNTLEALKGSAIGTALGILVFVLVDNN